MITQKQVNITIRLSKIIGDTYLETIFCAVFGSGVICTIIQLSQVENKRKIQRNQQSNLLHLFTVMVPKDYPETSQNYPKIVQNKW